MYALNKERFFYLYRLVLLFNLFYVLNCKCNTFLLSSLVFLCQGLMSANNIYQGNKNRRLYYYQKRGEKIYIIKEKFYKLTKQTAEFRKMF